MRPAASPTAASAAKSRSDQRRDLIRLVTDNDLKAVVRFMEGMSAVRLEHGIACLSDAAGITADAEQVRCCCPIGLVVFASQREFAGQLGARALDPILQ